MGLWFGRIMGKEHADDALIVKKYRRRTAITGSE